MISNVVGGKPNHTLVDLVGTGLGNLLVYETTSAASPHDPRKHTHHSWGRSQGLRRNGIQPGEKIVQWLSIFSTSLGSDRSVPRQEGTTQAVVGDASRLWLVDRAAKMEMDT